MSSSVEDTMSSRKWGLFFFHLNTQLELEILEILRVDPNRKASSHLISFFGFTRHSNLGLMPKFLEDDYNISLEFHLNLISRVINNLENPSELQNV